MINKSRIIKIKRAKKQRQQITDDLKQIMHEEKIDHIMFPASNKYINSTNEKITNLVQQRIEIEVTLSNSKEKHIKEIRDNYENNKYITSINYNSRQDIFRVLLIDENSRYYGTSFEDWSQYNDCYKLITIQPQELIDKINEERKKRKYLSNDIKFKDIYKNKNNTYHAYFNYNKLKEILSSVKQRLKGVQLIIKSEEEYFEPQQTKETNITDYCINSVLKLEFSSFVKFIASKFN